MKQIVPYAELEEFNTTSIDMGDIGNKPLPTEYYDIQKFMFTDAYKDFLAHIVGKMDISAFETDFPIVIPE